METKEQSIEELTKIQAPDNYFVFELGGAESPEKIELKIPFDHLKSLRECLDVLIELSKKPQPKGNTGFILTYPGRRRETCPVSD